MKYPKYPGVRKLLVVLILAVAGPLFCEPVVWQGQRVAITPADVKTFSDPGGGLRIDEVRQREFQPASSLNFSMSKEARWITLSVRCEADQQMFLKLAHPLLDELDFYIFTDDGAMQHIETGRSKPLSTWSMVSSDFIVPLSLERGESARIYIRMRSGNSRVAPIEFLGVYDLLKETLESALFYSIILGGMLFIILNNLILFLALKELSHLYFAGYMFSVFLFLLGLTGYGPVLLWGSIPYISERVVTFCMGACATSLLYFQSDYLQLRQRRPVLFRIFQASGAFYLGQMLLSLLPSYVYASMVGVYSGPFVAILLITVSALEIRRSYEGRMLFISWLVVLGAVALFAMKVAGLFPDHPVFHMLLPLGFLGQMLFINYHFSRRINDLNTSLEKEKQRMVDESKRLEAVLDESRAISLNLKELSEREKQMAARLNHLSQEEASMSEQLSSAMEEVFARTEGVRKGMQNQSEKAGRIDESLLDLLRTRETVREAVDRTTSFFGDIQQGFGAFRTNLEELMKRMHAIREAGNIIQDVVKMIRDITERINMLSLNASIEAARAGEPGRGFAVVADEVGKLAEETGSNSKKIQGQVALMEAEMSGGLEAAARSEASIDELLQSLGEAQSLLERVSQAMDVLDGAVNRLEDHSKENRKLSNEIFEASSEQMESLKESLGSVSRLAQMATQLSKDNDEILELSEAVLAEADRLMRTMKG